MNGATGTSPEREEQLRVEAAGWFARMRREDADLFKGSFEEWLAEPEHRAAFNRIAARFADAKQLHAELASPFPVNLSPPPRIWSKRLPAIAGLLTILLSAVTIVTVSSGNQASFGTQANKAAASGEFATARGEIRTVRLADGSHLIIDTDSLVSFAFTAGERRLRLERGRARFDVEHERRPFIVEAGEGNITARGTVFDVAIEEQTVRVALLRGAVDVTAVSRTTREDRVSRSLAPGGEIAFAANGFETRALPKLLAAEAGWPEAMIRFDAVPLESVARYAGRYSPIRIVASDPATANLRISGRFRVNDPVRLAAHIAHVLDLKVDTSHPGTILLTRR